MKHLFWFDTLCIPVKPEDARLRNVAIDSMASIYAGAHVVLVLDAELMNNPYSIVECLPRIACSIWMCRSWTLQEGVLSKRYAFQFHDATLIRRSWWQSVHRDPSSRRWDWARHGHTHDQITGPLRYRDSGSNEYQPMNNLLSIGHPSEEHVELARMLDRRLANDFFDTRYGTQSQRFVLVWNALACRSTTKPEDLFLILSNLLSLSPLDVQAISPELRLPAIITSLDAIPFSLLMDPGPKHIRQDSNASSWLPEHLGRHTLALTPLVNVEKRMLKFCKQTPWKNDLAIHVSQQVIPTNLDQFKVRLAPGGSTYIFRVSSGELNLSMVRGTCFVLPKTRHDPKPQNQGAVFDVAEWSQDDKGQRMTISFRCCAVVSVVDHSDALEGAMDEFLVDALDSSTDIGIIHGT